MLNGRYVNLDIDNDVIKTSHTDNLYQTPLGELHTAAPPSMTKLNLPVINAHDLPGLNGLLTSNRLLSLFADKERGLNHLP